MAQGILTPSPGLHPLGWQGSVFKDILSTDRENKRSLNRQIKEFSKDYSAGALPITTGVSYYQGVYSSTHQLKPGGLISSTYSTF